MAVACASACDTVFCPEPPESVDCNPHSPLKRNCMRSDGLGMCRCLTPSQSGSCSLIPPACLMQLLGSWDWMTVLTRKSAHSFEIVQLMHIIVLGLLSRISEQAQCLLRSWPWRVSQSINGIGLSAALKDAMTGLCYATNDLKNMNFDSISSRQEDFD